ncbi:hypothetical protein SDC9_69207 [bioreactor metagenome]|uniref:Uncharacterized protein n=1 Tax=bioreactor metagenome TaxID=1076179 RepID=A0A644Y323_9ZZZZ
MSRLFRPFVEQGLVVWNEKCLVAGLALFRYGKDQCDFQMYAPLFHDGGGAAVFVHGVAGEVEGLQIALRDLLLMVMADHAHTMQLQWNRIFCELTLKRPHQPGECGDGREAMRERAGDGVGVLHA